MAASSSSRWCPTQEQVMILEEIYNKGGIKTPNAFQIQQITTHLSFYGKVEGKNVFYWFQNHKARERQKLRRKLIMQNHKQLQVNLHQFQPLWYHSSVPSASHAPSHQADKLSPCCSIGHASLKTLELFPLKSTILNNTYQNTN